MSRTVKVACIQNNASGPHQENIVHAMAMVERAAKQGARLICLPEYYSGFGYRDGRLDPPAFAEPGHQGLASAVDAACRHGVWLLVGSIAVRLADGRIANRGYVIDDRGGIVARYDKIHLFDVDLEPGKATRESAVISPGVEAVVAETPWGGLGMTICYDLRFAGLYRSLAHAGASLLAIPAAFTRMTGEAHWHVLCRARAIENAAFVIAPCQHGSFPGAESYGHSLIVDPWGRVLADGGPGEAVVIAELDLDEVERCRNRIPALRHDRPFTLREVAG
jgi:predicted amidohydrolase